MSISLLEPLLEIRFEAALEPGVAISTLEGPYLISELIR